MTDSETSQLDAELLALRVAKQSALVDAARRSSISRLEFLVRVVAFVALGIYLDLCDIDLGGVLFGYTVFFLVVYSRDSKRREQRIDALVELLGLKDSHVITLKGKSTEPAGGGYPPGAGGSLT